MLRMLLQVLEQPLHKLPRIPLGIAPPPDTNLALHAEQRALHPHDLSRRRHGDVAALQCRKEWRTECGVAQHLEEVEGRQWLQLRELRGGRSDDRLNAVRRKDAEKRVAVSEVAEVGQREAAREAAAGRTSAAARG